MFSFNVFSDEEITNNFSKEKRVEANGQALSEPYELRDNELERGMIFYEPPPKVLISGQDTIEEVTYKERRPKWSDTISVSYTQFNPSFYTPRFYPTTFDELYLSDDIPLVELAISFNRSFSLGLLSLDVGIGIYENESDIIEEPSNLSLQIVKLGGSFMMDNLFDEPYIVPYINGGAYIIFYKEELESLSFNGNTSPAPYLSLGVSFQLDWMDKEASHTGFVDSGILNSFIFIEAKKHFSSYTETDPDFETDFDLSSGLKVQF